jgi:phosphatidylserine/phosphatidylglycerophosphate/cardiolipin synthase-like enzyme
MCDASRRGFLNIKKCFVTSFRQSFLLSVYVQNLVKLALGSRRSIQIATCYLFATDPAARYIILDLLPYCARTNGVTIEILVDSLTIESAVVRSAFYDADKKIKIDPHAASQKSTSDITGWSFVDLLPHGAPEPAQAKRSFESPLHFVEELDLVVAANPSFHVRWWCARDADMQYRIKNHCKCFIADQEVAMVGGSNLAPTVSAAESELDLLLSGPVVEQVSASFDSMWQAMDPVSVLAVGSTSEAAPIAESCRVRVGESGRNCLGAQLDESSWDDVSARVSLVRSFPSSAGEDAIYRMILGALQIAKKRIIISMGHSNHPKSLANILAAATERGVQVQVLANSKYSCDLLVNQRDLMLSCRDLLRIAPNVELYLTHRKPGGPRPPFAHAKYVTMDGTWSAIGSWNVWTRGSFYEMEHEAMIESTVIASLLEAKFQVDRATTVRVFKAEELEPGGDWCSSGCSVCRGFGPFFRP